MRGNGNCPIASFEASSLLRIDHSDISERGPTATCPASPPRLKPLLFRRLLLRYLAFLLLSTRFVPLSNPNGQMEPIPVFIDAFFHFIVHQISFPHVCSSIWYNSILLVRFRFWCTTPRLEASIYFKTGKIERYFVQRTKNLPSIDV